MNKLIKKIIYRMRGEFTIETLISKGLTVGNNLKILNGVIIDPTHCFLISLGDNVTLAPRVHILAHDASTKTLLGYTKIARVSIGNNVFIGAGSIVLPGVTIGDNCIIGAGSIVTKSVPMNSVCVGNPCKMIMKTSEYIERNKEAIKNCPVFGKEYFGMDININKKMEMKEKLENTKGYMI